MTTPFRRSLCVVGLVSAVLALSACGNPKKSLGLEKNAPDEFSVVPRAPLALPPDYAMRPPQPGADRPQEISTRDLARSQMIGSAGGAGSADLGGSNGESALLRQAGTNRADPNIRTTVNRESSILAEEDRSFTDRLVFWRKAEEPGLAVDPNAESRRIRENQALGKATTDGQTPVIERKERGFLEGIF